MGYGLGIDLGTTFTAAAVSTGTDVRSIQLGMHRAVTPTVVLARADTTVLVGDAAEARATTEPTAVAREFKRRLGDTTPLMLSGSPYSAGLLLALVTRDVVARVEEQMGGATERIVVTHPAAYTEYRRDVLRSALREVGLDVELATEPQAAAAFHASQAKMAPGEVVAVYDFGGGTFDAALVRCEADGFTLVGEPQGLERLGGIDFDQAVFDHVCSEAGIDLDSLAPGAATLAAVARLRADCRTAKELLSTDDTAIVPIFLPGHQGELTVHRSTLERMIRPRLPDTLAAMRRASESAGVALADISAVLLVGGSSRIPLVRSYVADSTGRPLALDADAQQAIALGAALLAAPTPANLAAAAPVPAAAPVADGTPPPAVVHAHGRRGVRWLPVGIAAAIVAAVIAGIVLLSGDDAAAPGTTAQSGAPKTDAPPATGPAVTELLDSVFLNRGFTYGGETWSLAAAAITNQRPADFDPAATTGGSDTTSLVTDWRVERAVPGLELPAILLIDGVEIPPSTVINVAPDRSYVRYAFSIAEGTTFEGLAIQFGDPALTPISPVGLFTPASTFAEFPGEFADTATVTSPSVSEEDGDFTFDGFVVTVGSDLPEGALRDSATSYADLRAPDGAVFLHVSTEVKMGACTCPDGVTRVPGSAVMPFQLGIDSDTFNFERIPQQRVSTPTTMRPGDTQQIEVVFVVEGVPFGTPASLALTNRASTAPMPTLLEFALPGPAFVG